MELEASEKAVKDLTAYAWLAYRFPEAYPEMDLCLERRQELNAFIERTLSARSLPRACPSCGATLKANHRFKICDACHTVRKEERANGTNPGRPPHRFHQARRGPPPSKRGGKARPAKPAPSPR